MIQIVITSLSLLITTCAFYQLVFPGAEKNGKILFADTPKNSGEEISKKAIKIQKSRTFVFRVYLAME